MIGERICIVTAPLGPPCCVRTPSGQLVRGHRVPPDFPRGTSDVVVEGECVEYRVLDANGSVVFDKHGRQQSHKSANGWSFNTFDGKPVVTQVKLAEPPPLVRR